MRPNLWADRIYLSKMWHTPENPRSSVDAIKQPQSSCLFSKLVCLWMFSLNTFNKSKVCNKDYSNIHWRFLPARPSQTRRLSWDSFRSSWIPGAQTCLHLTIPTRSSPLLIMSRERMSPYSDGRETSSSGMTLRSIIIFWLVGSPKVVCHDVL